MGDAGGVDEDVGWAGGGEGLGDAGLVGDVAADALAGSGE
jgi:hypothetical protein